MTDSSELQARLETVAAAILKASKEIDRDERAEETGFVGYDLHQLVLTVLELVRISPPPRTVLDMGCGDGRFALLCATAGYESFGVEINPFLVTHARAITAQVLELLRAPCSIAQGDMFLREFRAPYKEFLAAHNAYPNSSPVSEDTEEVYDTLPVTPQNADIIYCYAWPTQSRFVYNYLNDVACEEAVFVLPAYERYTTGEHLNASFRIVNTLILQQLSTTGAFIGRHVEPPRRGLQNEDS